MNEEQELQQLLAREAELDALLAKEAELDALLAKAPAAPEERSRAERFLEPVLSTGTLMEPVETAGEFLSMIPKAAGSVVAAAGREAEQNPLMAASTGGISTLVNPVIKAGANYLSSTPGSEMRADAAETALGLVPFGDFIANVAKKSSFETGVPRAEEVGTMFKESLGSEALGFGLGKIGQKLVKGVDAVFGPAQDRLGMFAQRAKKQQDALAAQFNPMNARTPSGIGQTTDALSSIDIVRSELGDSLSKLPRDKQGYDLAKTLLKAKRIEAGRARQSLLEEADVVANNLGPLAKKDDVFLDKIRPADIDFSGVDEYASSVGYEGKGSVLLAQQRYYDPVLQQGKQSLSDLQHKIKQIDKDIASLGAYDSTAKAQISLELRSPEDEVEILKRYRQAYQDAIVKRLDELGAVGAIAPGAGASYKKYNSVVSAMHEFEPLMRRFEAEGIAALQPGSPASLNTATTARGAAAQAATNVSTKKFVQGLNREAEMITRMQSMLDPEANMSLLSRSFEVLRSSPTQNGIVANAAFQLGALASPQQWDQLPKIAQKQIYEMLVQNMPGMFELPVSGMASEIDGKILNPFEADEYVVQLFEETADNSTKRADLLGKYVSTKKVAVPMGVSQASIGPRPIDIIELAPDVDGGFSFNDSNAQSEQMEDQSITAMLLNANLTRQLQDLSN